MKPRPAGTERRPWRLEKSILCGQGSLDMLVMKISGAPSKPNNPAPKVSPHRQLLLATP
jgi:hypothetical protein